MLKEVKTNWVEFGLRYTLALGFLSAVADRFGFWYAEVAVWGNWNSFIEYTKVLNPWFPTFLIPFIGGFVTLLEVCIAIAFIIRFKIKQTALISGGVLLCFAVAMILTTGLKGVLDYGVLPLAFASFLLAKNRKD